MAEVLSISMQIVSSISVISSMSVVFVYYRFPHLQKKSYFTLQNYVAISSALTSIGSAIGIVKDGTFACWFQGFSTNIFTLSSIQWTSIMVMSLFSIVHYEKQLEVTPLIHLYCWLPPILATVLPLINSTYGNVGNWCWVIETDKTPKWGGMFWFWVSFYGWVWFSCFIMLILLLMTRFVSARKESKSTVRSRGAATLKKVIATLDLYPLVILIAWGPTCIADTISQLGGRYILTFGGIGAVCSCAQGIFTALIFWLRNDEIRKIIPQFFNKYAQVSDSTTVGASSHNESLKSLAEQVDVCISAVSRLKGNHFSSHNNNNHNHNSHSNNSQNNSLNENQVDSTTSFSNSYSYSNSKNHPKSSIIGFGALLMGANPFDSRVGTKNSNMSDIELGNKNNVNHNNVDENNNNNNNRNNGNDNNDNDDNVRDFKSSIFETGTENQAS